MFLKSLSITLSVMQVLSQTEYTCCHQRLASEETLLRVHEVDKSIGDSLSEGWCGDSSVSPPH